MCIVVEVTLNKAEYGSQRSHQPVNVNFEPIIRGLKMIFLTGTKCKTRFIYVRFNRKTKKWGKNGWWPVRQGEVCFGSHKFQMGSSVLVKVQNVEKKTRQVDNAENVKCQTVRKQ